MRLALLSLTFATLLAAAPAPVAAPPELGSSGIVTTEELKAVPFKSRVLKTAEELKELKLKVGERPEDYDVALHLPRARFKFGEPIPAHFIVKNALDRKIGLRMLVDFSGIGVKLRGECHFTIRVLGGTKTHEMLVMHSTHCSEDSLADLPPNGFYVARGDLNRLGDTPLPPGEYEVGWSCQLRESALVSFTVLPGDAPKPRPKEKPNTTRFVSIVPDAPEAGDEDTFRWADFELVPNEGDRMAAALACGPFGKHVPDVSRIPANDGRIEVRASLRQEKNKQTLIVSLRSADPRREVFFTDIPKLHLQLEVDSPDEGRRRQDRSLRDLIKRAVPVWKTPMTIEVPFDNGRWKEADFGPGRMAVLVTSGKVELPTRGRRIQDVQESIRHARTEAEPPWTGLVRSEFIPLNK